jgi:hypothetical protein
MKLGLQHFLLLGVAAAIGQHLFGKKNDPRDRILLTGSMTLAPGVPYRLTYETTDILAVDTPTHTVTGRQNDVRTELAGSGAYDVTFDKLPALGKYAVRFVLAPRAPVSIAIGSQLSPSGQYAPRMKLIAIQRADGGAL